ncbi:lysophospholipid acyltransferase family protein [Aureimonas frigidaquae]|uniref:lysophospholipid acyltransferase family protein n=1 Tax=Aureimonas frigidaquae TaxID=424757 RepID=UPI000784D751|nr:1-acyl-sn-glycerol-3-phosphate acyltransferase [Aureimonas frigidaquae]
MIALRSFAFQCLFYANLIGQLIVFSPIFFLASEARCWRIVKNWARSSMWLLHHVAGTRSRISGRERLPKGGAIIAAKHQSFWETFALLPELDRPTFILKKELIAIPLFGAYCRRMGMIPVDRSRRGGALAGMLAAAQAAMREGRQIVIFPEGTRSAPGADPNYRPGIHYLYEALEVPVVPVALNSGLFWPRQAFYRRPGTIRAEFLDPIAPGLDKPAFLARLTDEIEARTLDLIRQAYAEQPDLPVSKLLASRLYQDRPASEKVGA